MLCYIGMEMHVQRGDKKRVGGRGDNVLARQIQRCRMEQ